MISSHRPYNEFLTGNFFTFIGYMGDGNVVIYIREASTARNGVSRRQSIRHNDMMEWNGSEEELEEWKTRSLHGQCEL